MGFFTGAGRLGRLHFFGIGLGISLTVLLAAAVMTSTDPFTGEATVSPAILPIWALGVWLSVANMIRRLHDRGHSGWMGFLALVPIVGIAVSLYLLFMPGEKLANLYGPAPGPTVKITPEAQRARVDQIAADAAEAYKAKETEKYYNEDGSYNMDGLGTEQAAPK